MPQPYLMLKLLPASSQREETVALITNKVCSVIAMIRTCCNGPGPLFHCCVGVELVQVAD